LTDEKEGDKVLAMRHGPTKNTDELESFPLRLKVPTIVEIKRRAEADRRPPSQWLRNLIEDALLNKKVVVK
jgi:hypothetical protein